MASFHVQMLVSRGTVLRRADGWAGVAEFQHSGGTSGAISERVLNHPFEESADHGSEWSGSRIGICVESVEVRSGCTVLEEVNKARRNAR
jgi:hypothetical protein